MRGCKQVTRILKMTALTAPLVVVLAFAVDAQAQWPRPATPPPPANLPSSQTVPAGFDELGFIEYASVDATCAAASSLTLDTSAGIGSPMPTPTPIPPVPSPTGCKT